MTIYAVPEMTGRNGRAEYLTVPLPGGVPEDDWEARYLAANLELEPDEFDAQLDREILVGRLGHESFNRHTFASALGVSPGVIWTLVARGNLPEPDGYEHVEPGRKQARWTIEQVVEAQQRRAK